MTNEATPAKVRPNDGLGPLVEAAEKYAANYNDDERQDIRCDVLNAWHAGAKFAQAAERERLAADIKVLSLAARAVSTALDELVGACMDDFMDPKVPSRRALMHARSMLPPTCGHALKKAPAGEKT